MGLCSGKDCINGSPTNKQQNKYSPSCSSPLSTSSSGMSIACQPMRRQCSLRDRRGLNVKKVKVDIREAAPPSWWVGSDKPVKTMKWKDRVLAHSRRRERKFLALVYEARRQAAAKRIQVWWRARQTVERRHALMSFLNKRLG